ncbi:MAG: hypothetical protein CVV64_03960 [Candidatus Wallbacteria bacterium HGW-Wallbacteria-1]|jgi:hypothetical protein|uniref:Uncharacterized protein n=1 Tax=Candidatus Wallbacteria bacterium HGW-Wallbacteria-1 TaxID=2013854 RepID=A0A2N1PRG4_9BACT|nr:MAG: hypothetical protein CVV64_03960 [Candidatus Wallbacteria bacterium HGW-Wallbacteria-1]
MKSRPQVYTISENPKKWFPYLKYILIILAVLIPVAGQEILSLYHVYPDFSFITLLMSSTIVMILGIFSISATTIFIFLLYSMLFFIWLMNFDIRIADDLMIHLNKPNKVQFRIPPKMKSPTLIELPVMTNEGVMTGANLRKFANQRIQDEYVKRENSEYFIVKNRLWCLSIPKKFMFEKNNKLLRNDGSSVDDYERMITHFRYW